MRGARERAAPDRNRTARTGGNGEPADGQPQARGRRRGSRSPLASTRSRWDRSGTGTGDPECLLVDRDRTQHQRARALGPVTRGAVARSPSEQLCAAPPGVDRTSVRLRAGRADQHHPARQRRFLDSRRIERRRRRRRFRTTAGPRARLEENATDVVVVEGSGHHVHHRAGRRIRMPSCARRPKASRPRIRCDQADKRARPLARRLFSTARPARVDMRARNPWRLARRWLLGWNVRFTGSSSADLACTPHQWPLPDARDVLLQVRDRSAHATSQGYADAPATSADTDASADGRSNAQVTRRTLWPAQSDRATVLRLPRATGLSTPVDKRVDVRVKRFHALDQGATDSGAPAPVGLWDS